MSLSFALALLAAAAPSGDTPAPVDDTPPRVLVLDLGHSQELSSDVAQTVGEMLTTEVARRPGIEVVSTSDVKEMIALASERQAAGCDDTDCLAEVAGALGADFVISGRVSALGARTVLQLNLFDAARGKPVARTNRDVADVAAFIDALPDMVDELLPVVAGLPSESASPAGEGPPVLALAGGGLAAGGVAVGTGGALLALVIHGALDDSQSRSIGDFRALQYAGLAVLAGGVAAATVGVAGGAALVAMGLNE